MPADFPSTGKPASAVAWRTTALSVSSAVVPDDAARTAAGAAAVGSSCCHQLLLCEMPGEAACLQYSKCQLHRGPHPPLSLPAPPLGCCRNTLGERSVKPTTSGSVARPSLRRDRHARLPQLGASTASTTLHHSIRSGVAGGVNPPIHSAAHPITRAFTPVSVRPRAGLCCCEPAPS